MTRVLVHGGGVPAIATAIALLDAGLSVDLTGPTDAAREPHLPEGGIVYGHDTDALAQTFAAGDEPTATHRALAEVAPDIVRQLESWGVPFVRDGDELALRRLPGWAEAHAAFAGASTALVTAWALDLELTRRARKGSLRRSPEHELVELVQNDEGAVVGAILRSRISGSIEAIPASAVVLASGCPPGSVAGTSAVGFPETVVAAAYRAGAALRGTGRPRLHPTILAHGRHPQPLSGALRAEGARFWVPVDDQEARIPRDIPTGDRDYFVREELGEEGRLEDDRVLAELVRRVTTERGVYDRVERASKGTAYLDISHLPPGHLAARVGDELRAIAARAPRDPSDGPFEVSSGAVSLGAALAVEEDGELEGRTSLHGLWAVGTAAWRDLADKDGLALVAAIHHGRRAAAAIRRSLEDATPSEASALDDAVATFGDLDDAPEVDGAAAELAERIDALAFDDEDPDDLAPRLEALLEEVTAVGPSTDLRHRGLIAGLEIGLAACRMSGRRGVSMVERNDDGLPEDA